MRHVHCFSVLLACAIVVIWGTCAGATVLSDNLIGYWAFDDPAGSTTAADSSGKGYDGSLVDSSTGATVFGVAGKVGTGWQTDSNGAGWPGMTSDYIQLPSSAGNELRLANTSFTLTGWFKFDDVAASGHPHHFSGNNNGVDKGYHNALFSGAGLPTYDQEFAAGVGGASAAIPKSNLPGGPWNNGSWYFFASRYDMGSGQLINWLAREDQNWGSKSGSVANPPAAPGDPGLDPRIGRDTAPGAFDGVRDEFAIWNRAVTNDELGEIFNFNKAGLSLGALLADKAQLRLGDQPDEVGAQNWDQMPDANSGAESVIRVGRATAGPGSNAMRGLLAFDLDGLQDANIKGVTLKMTIADAGDGAPGAVELHEVTAALPMTEGTGTITVTGDGVTWNTIDGANAWATAGGDFSSTVLSSVPGAGSSGASGDMHVYGSSDAFVAATQAAVDSGSPLELILISPSSEAGGGQNFWRYASDDHATVGYRPMLEIYYTIPEPGSCLLLVLGGVALLAIRRRK